MSEVARGCGVEVEPDVAAELEVCQRGDARRDASMSLPADLGTRIEADVAGTLARDLCERVARLSSLAVGALADAPGVAGADASAAELGREREGALAVVAELERMLATFGDVALGEVARRGQGGGS
jgi:hypothetical protein